MKVVADETMNIKYETLLQENKQLREKLTDTIDTLRVNR